jgi:heterotetrameric sarcosine oxidase delta subunit
MLITCPYCGARDVSEFIYQGDGNRVRPDPMSQDIAAWNEYIHDRVNIADELNEIWQHSGGCRSHLAIVRNTLTHKVSSVHLMRERKPALAVRTELSTTQTALEEQALKVAKAAAKPAARTARTAVAAPKKTAAKSSATAKPAAKSRGTK